jgi:16S rRNA (adenine1518-N6/adenine1519-N6)-dimethyltransferase
VVANIPYYITSALIRHLLAGQNQPERIVLTMQKEVAARICARAGDYSLLSLSVQVFGDPQVVLHIGAGSFFPPPNVDSATLRIDLYDNPMIPTDGWTPSFNWPTLFCPKAQDLTQHPLSRPALERR